MQPHQVPQAGSLQLLALENQAGDNASCSRGVEAALAILGCWASQKEFSEYGTTVS